MAGADVEGVGLLVSFVALSLEDGLMRLQPATQVAMIVASIKEDNRERVGEDIGEDNLVNRGLGYGTEVRGV